LSRFSILPIVNQLGESVVVSGVTRTYNTRGDVVESYTAYSFSGAIVQVLTAEDELVKEGILRPEDIVLYFDESESNVANVKPEDYVHWGGRIYSVNSVVKNLGHYEVQAKCVSGISSD